jgi:RNA polymerase sigma-70 factor (ECF subfamily)
MTSASVLTVPSVAGAAPDAAVTERFEQIVMPHVDSAFNLARWIVRNRDDAEDVAQEAMLRALRFFATYNGGDARAWLLQIVRNSSYTWLEKNRPADLAAKFDEHIHSSAAVAVPPNPESLAIAANDRVRLQRALETLPPKQREVIVLRELEGCSYKEIAAITEIPIGTVMSALSRARTQLQSALTTGATKEISRGV